MINSITVTNHIGESVKIEMRFPEKSGFLIKSIDGLGPSRAEINKTEIANIDGSFFNSSRVISRNVVLNLKFLRFPTIETTRLNSYKYFPIKKRIKLEIETDKRDGFTYGYIESNEPDIFSSDEGSIISIICPTPYFYEVNDQLTSFSSVDPVFEFPFSNESTTLKLLNFGDISLEMSKNIYYSGDASVGLILIVNAIGSIHNIEITKVSTNETIFIDSDIVASITGSDIIAGDQIIISTSIGEKYAVLIRDGVEYNIRNAIGKYPTWFQLNRGDNLFSYDAETGVQNLQFTVINSIAYEGI